MEPRVRARQCAAFLFALTIVACRTAPVLTPDIAVTNLSTGKARTEAQVAEAIKRAGKIRGWEIAEAGPGHLTGTINVRKHRAVVDIAYSKTNVKIAYKDSTNLSYKNGSIHRNYNNWVKNLAESIRQELGQGT